MKDRLTAARIPHFGMNLDAPFAAAVINTFIIKYLSIFSAARGDLTALLRTVYGTSELAAILFSDGLSSPNPATYFRNDVNIKIRSTATENPGTGTAARAADSRVMYFMLD